LLQSDSVVAAKQQLILLQSGNSCCKVILLLLQSSSLSCCKASTLAAQQVHLLQSNLVCADSISDLAAEPFLIYCIDEPMKWLVSILAR